jgi:hypothetical protein
MRTVAIPPIDFSMAIPDVRIPVRVSNWDAARFGPPGFAIPVKYRWPVFDLEASSDQDYSAIIDEECKVRAYAAGEQVQALPIRVFR